MGTLTSYWRNLYWVNFYPNDSAVSFTLFLFAFSFVYRLSYLPSLTLFRSCGPLGWSRLFPTPSVLATRLASFQISTHSFISFSTVLLHVVLGRPTFLRLSVCLVIAVKQSLSPSNQSTCPIHFHLLTLTSSRIFKSLSTFIWYYIWPFYLQLFF